MKNECPLCKKILDIYEDVPAHHILDRDDMADINLPFEAYFREVRDLHDNIQLLDNFRATRVANNRRIDNGREYELALLALHNELRTIQRSMMQRRILETAIQAALQQRRNYVNGRELIDGI